MKHPLVMDSPRLFPLFMKAALGIALGALGFGFAGCAKDQTVDDWRRAKVAEQLAKVEKIEGTYRGVLESRLDRGTMGVLTVEMHPDTRIQDSADRLNSEQQAIVRGVVTYSGITQATAVFDRGFYDDKTGMLKVSFVIVDASGASIQMNLSGSLRNEVFQGQIEADGYSEYGASFSLGRNAPAPIDSRLTSRQTVESRGEQRGYKGTYLLKGERREIRMTLVSRRTTAEQALVDLFSPIRKFQVTLDFGRWDVFFESAQLDDQIRRLIAQTVVNGSSPGEKYALSLDCTRNGAGFDCWVETAGKQKLRIAFVPEAAPQTEVEAAPEATVETESP